jgi:signal transduction histidine kinase
MKKTLHFKTNTLLKNLVGKDLINNDNIAIVELVKNSYDAKSKNVFVTFTDFSDKYESTDLSKIIIADQGIGMNLTDVEDKWLNIAYSEKILLKQRAGAYLAGNKGIGRFSCDRLGERLDLLTRKKNQDLLHLSIWWPDFEITGKKDLIIQDIDIHVDSIDELTASTIAETEKFPTTGTILVISSLRSQWDRQKLGELKTALEKFLNPNLLFLREQFRIYLSVPELEKIESNKNYTDRITGQIQNQIFEKLKFNTTYIEANISEDNEQIITSLYHEGEKVFNLVERNDQYTLLNGLKVIIYYLNPYKKAYFKRQTGVRLVDFGSIFLFLNGFRISPYGDRGDDWLGLDVRKTQGTNRYLSSRDMVGRIEIICNDDRFIPVSSREGLKNTSAFRKLRTVFFIDVLRKLERFVVEGLQWDSVPDELRQGLIDSEGLDWNSTSERYSESWERKKQRIALSIMPLIGSSPDRIINFWFNPSLLEGIYESRQEDVKRLLNNIEKVEPGKVDPDLSKNLNRIRKIIEEKEADAIVARSEANQLRLEAVRNKEEIKKLSSTSETYRAQTLFLQQVTSVDVKQLLTFHHQISLESTYIDNYLSKAIKAIRNNVDSRQVMEYLEKASMANKKIAAIAQFATKANFRSATKNELTDIPTYFEQYILNVAKDYIGASLKLVVHNSVKEAFEIKASRIELSMLIDNIISNASKALANRLLVEISKVSENTLIIAFIDDGKGISKDLPTIDSMFEMGITTTSGSGLGLYHSKNIVESMGGKIYALPCKPNGMEIRIEVTR